MAGNLPAYILKNATLFVDKESKIGQSEEITLPTIEAKTEEMRNGGMIKPREVSFGFNALNVSFTLSGVDPAMFGLFGIAVGKSIPIIAYGYLQDEDGKTHSARCEMTCMPKKLDLGGWKSGDPSPLGCEFAVHAYRLFVDDIEIAVLDDFEAKFGGVNVTPGANDALRLS